MSQDYFQQPGSSKHPEEPSSPASDEHYPHHRPNYLTVGSGSISESAQRLTTILDDDSGYGSMIEGSLNSRWNASLAIDTPIGSPSRFGQNAHSETERRAMASHVHQLYYNHNRTALGRAINRTMEALKNLQEVNREWPAHYPSVKPPTPIRQPHSDSRPGLHHTHSTWDNPIERPLRPSAPRRAETSFGEGSSQAGPSSAATVQQDASPPEPRLVTPQLAREFAVLKIDLKMDGLQQNEIIHSLRKDSKALAQLLDGQINRSLHHLTSLRERIEDTSSKVLVTGDLNAGKSTFCNALLRKKILPVDEQPCTSIFCEVLDVRENGGVEEVHAVPLGSTYDRNNERSYSVHPLSELENIVVDSDRFSQCKVFISDIRGVDESLLNNGVLDIALIDAPGLNNDSLKTTALFARQEEIDVVVFVVSAANHFTLSAREFIYNAAREKAYIFMVVNGFDSIRNKQRCQEQILKQVAHLSPATFKESRELVHFVSSNAIPVAPSDGFVNGHASGGGGSGSVSGGPNYDPGDGGDGGDGDGSDGKNGDEGDTTGKGKGKARQMRRDFAELEASLRRFVLEKRARSKLAPAKTYLMNVLGDLHDLATVNRDVAQNELDRVSTELQKLEPVLDQSRKVRNQASEETDRSIEKTAADVYAHTRDTLTTTIANVSQHNLGVTYPGFWDAYKFAEDITAAMLQEISSTVNICEDYARNKTTDGVNIVKSLGVLHLGDAYTDLIFNSDRMLRRRKDVLARQVAIDVEMWDFFDFASLWERQEKVAGTGMAVTLAGLLGGQLLGSAGWIDGALGAAKVLGSRNLRRLLIPGLLGTVLVGVSYAITSIPTSLPRRLSAKVADQLAAIDFTHTNAQRISTEVRRALAIPADNLRSGLQRNVEQLQGRREETNRIRIESEVARKYFGNLVRESGEIKAVVERVDLEGPAPGVAGAYDG